MSQTKPKLSWCWQPCCVRTHPRQSKTCTTHGPPRYDFTIMQETKTKPLSFWCLGMCVCVGSPIPHQLSLASRRARLPTPVLSSCFLLFHHSSRLHLLRWGEILLLRSATNLYQQIKLFSAKSITYHTRASYPTRILLYCRSFSNCPRNSIRLCHHTTESLLSRLYIREKNLYYHKGSWLFPGMQGIFDW